MSDENVNPFDDERHPFLLLVNESRQYSLWPAFAKVPSGWQVAFGPDHRESCLKKVEQVWKNLRPASD